MMHARRMMVARRMIVALVVMVMAMALILALMMALMPMIVRLVQIGDGGRPRQDRHLLSGARCRICGTGNDKTGKPEGQNRLEH